MRTAVGEWQQQTLFTGHLKVGLDANNTAEHAKLSHTLAIAHSIDQQLTHKPIQRYLYEQPTASRFNTLAAHAAQLQTAMEAQTECCQTFAQRVKLNLEHWLHASGDCISSSN